MLSVFWKPGRKKKKEILTEKRYTDPMIAAQMLLAQSLLGATGASGAAQVNAILAGGCGIEDIINAVGAKLRAIANNQNTMVILAGGLFLRKTFLCGVVHTSFGTTGKLILFLSP